MLIVVHQILLAILYKLINMHFITLLFQVKDHAYSIIHSYITCIYNALFKIIGPTHLLIIYYSTFLVSFTYIHKHMHTHFSLCVLNNICLQVFNESVFFKFWLQGTRLFLFVNYMQVVGGSHEETTKFDKLQCSS